MSLPEKEKFTFGKYKGKTYGYVYQSDKGYCSWFIKNCRKGKSFKTFVLERGLFDPNAIKSRSTTASELAKRISFDPKIIGLVQAIVEAAETETTPLKEEEEEDEDEEPLEELLEELLEKPLEEPPGEPLGELLGEPLESEEELFSEDEEPLPELNVYRGRRGRGRGGRRRPGVYTKRTRVEAIPKRNITPQFFGHFVDIYIRYRIAFAIGIPFSDKKVERFVRVDPKTPVTESYKFLVDSSSDPNAEWNPHPPSGESPPGSLKLQAALFKCAVAESVQYRKRELYLTPRVLRIVDKFIEDYIIDAAEILTAPRISGGLISAEADLIFDDTLVDFKTGKTDSCYYISQLLVYTILYEKKEGKVINNIVIFNPIDEESVIKLKVSTVQKEEFRVYLEAFGLLP